MVGFGNYFVGLYKVRRAVVVTPSCSLNRILTLYNKHILKIHVIHFISNLLSTKLVFFKANIYLQLESVMKCAISGWN